MRKTTSFLFILGILLTFSMTSCEKDGVYTPKKKIQRVFYSSDYCDKHISEEWNWNGNLLESINHYDGGLSGEFWTEYFSYDGNRLSRVDDYIHSEYTTYEYDGKYLKSANFYQGNFLILSAQYTYEGNQLNKIVLTMYDDYFKSYGEKLLKKLSRFVPDEILQLINNGPKKILDSNSEKGIYTLSFQYTWTENNISKIILNNGGYMSTFSLQYDDKNNPKKGFFGLYSLLTTDFYIEEGNYLYLFSKNNVTKAIVTDYEGDNYVVNFTYQYDKDNYPTMKMIHDGDYTEIFYYEY